MSDGYITSLSKKYHLSEEIVAKVFLEKDKLKLLYMWIKQEHITLKQFRDIMLLLDEAFH